MTKEDYNNLVSDRPDKATAEEVKYRLAEGKERCYDCLHFFVRRLDKFAVCEIFRSEDTDEDGVNPKYVCDWFTPNGDDFPLRHDGA